MFLTICIFFGAVIVIIASKIKQKIQLFFKLKKLGAIDGIIATHVAGLELGSAVQCQIIRYRNRLLIDGTIRKFIIFFDQIQGLKLKSEHELKAIGGNYSSKFEAAIHKSIADGTYIVGNKIKRGGSSIYLVIQYIDQENNLSFIAFQCNRSNGIKKFSNNVNSSIGLIHAIVQ